MVRLLLRYIHRYFAPANAGDQVPPVAGLPPKAANNCADVTVLPAQIVSVPLVPAFGKACSLTTT